MSHNNPYTSSSAKAGKHPTTIHEQTIPSSCSSFITSLASSSLSDLSVSETSLDVQENPLNDKEAWLRS